MFLNRNLYLHVLEHLLFVVPWITISTGTVSSDDDFGTLVQINVLFRHGARTPMLLFPNSTFPQTTAPGQLTTTGMFQMYNLGKSMKRRYSHGYPFQFLPSHYNISEILVNSSMTTRTMESAYCLLAGMYPPRGKQIWNPHLLWQPIPVYTRDLWEDPACSIPDEGICPVIERLRAKEIHSEKALKTAAENKALFRYLDQKTGMKEGTTNLTISALIFDTLIMETEEGILSDWANGEWSYNSTVMDVLTPVKQLVFEARHTNGNLKKITAGKLLESIINNTKHLQQSDFKAFLYSVHEEKIGALLACLNISVGYNNVGSVVVLELYRILGNLSVKLAFKDGHQNDFLYLVIPGCGATDLCPLKEFERIGKHCTSIDWKKTCQTKTTYHRSRGTNKTSAVATAIAGSAIIICVVFGFYIIYAVVFRPGHKSRTGEDYGSLD